MKLRLFPLVALLAACASDPAPREPGSSASTENAVLDDLPWTEEFKVRAVLVANEVQIEGPPGLREHFVQVQDPTVHTYRMRTVPEGLLQETTVKEGGTSFHIRCNLDSLTIVAERRLTVLERPGEVPVRVIARGDAYWKQTNTDNERRGEKLELIGHRPR